MLEYVAVASLAVAEHSTLSADIDARHWREWLRAVAPRTVQKDCSYHVRPD